MARPREYEHRARLVLYLETAELRRLEQMARRAGAPSTAIWARWALVEVVARESAPVSERRAARSRDAVDAKGDRAAGRAGRAGAGRPLLHAAGDGPPQADLQVGQDRRPDRRRRRRHGTGARPQRGRP